MALDALMVCVAMAAALLLNGSTPASFVLLIGLLPLMALMTLIGTGASIWLGLPRIKLNAYETRGIIRTAIFSAILGITGATLNTGIGPVLPVEVFFIFSMFYLVMSATWRIALRQFLIWIYRRGQDRMRVLVYGAGQTGQQLVAALRTDDSIVPVAFVDDNPTLQSLMVAGLPVHAPSQIKDLITKKSIDRVVVNRRVKRDQIAV